MSVAPLKPERFPSLEKEGAGVVNRLTPPLLPHTRRIKHERRGLLSVHNSIVDSLTVRLLDSGPSRVQNTTNEPGMSMKTKRKVKKSGSLHDTPYLALWSTQFDRLSVFNSSAHSLTLQPLESSCQM